MRMMRFNKCLTNSVTRHAWRPGIGEACRMDSTTK